MPFEVKV